MYLKFYRDQLIYVILARDRNPPDDDVLTSKYVGASYIYIHLCNNIIRIIEVKLCICWLNCK